MSTTDMMESLDPPRGASRHPAAALQSNAPMCRRTAAPPASSSSWTRGRDECQDLQWVVERNKSGRVLFHLWSCSVRAKTPGVTIYTKETSHTGHFQPDFQKLSTCRRWFKSLAGGKRSGVNVEKDKWIKECLEDVRKLINIYIFFIKYFRLTCRSYFLKPHVSFTCRQIAIFGVSRVHCWDIRKPTFQRQVKVHHLIIIIIYFFFFCYLYMYITQTN